MIAVSDACNNNIAKINLIEESVNSIQKSNSACSDMEQLYMEFNDKQSRKNNSMFSEVRDNNDFAEDFKLWWIFSKKLLTLNPRKLNFIDVGYTTKEFTLKKADQFESHFKAEMIISKLLNGHEALKAILLLHLTT